MSGAREGAHSVAAVRALRHPSWRSLRPLAAVVALAAVAALLVGYRPTVSPLGLHPRGVTLASAHAQVLVDSSDSEIADYRQITEFRAILAAQLALNYALYLQSDHATATLGRELGLGSRRVAASGPYTLLLGRTNYAPAVPAPPQPGTVDHSYRLLLDVDGARPMIDLYAQTPTVRSAVALVDDARALLAQYVATQEGAHPLPGGAGVVLRPLGPAVAGVVDPQARWQLMVAAFLLVLVLGGSLVWARRWGLARAHLDGLASARLDGLASARLDRLDDPAAPGADEWPHTRRVLPWALAGFVTMLFLVPFDAISLPVHLPVNGTLDRPVVVALALLWLSSLALLSGAARPRLRLTPVHGALLAFLAVALLSAVGNVHALATLNETSLVVKKLGLLASYVLFFFIVASVLRPREVPRFAALMVSLAVVVAVGTIVEYRFHYNPFYELWGRVLPVTKPTGFDSPTRSAAWRCTGRRCQPLELAAMLAMMLPFAIIGAIDAPTRRRRVLYTIAVALLLAGGVATARKTSLVAPLAVVAIVSPPTARVPCWAGAAAGGRAARARPPRLARRARVGASASWSRGTSTRHSPPPTARRATTPCAPTCCAYPLLGRGYESYDPQQVPHPRQRVPRPADHRGAGRPACLLGDLPAR